MYVNFNAEFENLLRRHDNMSPGALLNLPLKISPSCFSDFLRGNEMSTLPWTYAWASVKEIITFLCTIKEINPFK